MEGVFEFTKKKINNPKDLPRRYIVVTETWQSYMGRLIEKLSKRGLRVPVPIRLYELNRKVGGIELCVELEKIDGD